MLATHAIFRSYSEKRNVKVPVRLSFSFKERSPINSESYFAEVVSKNLSNPRRCRFLRR